jgi:hypothetical protein
LLDCILHLIWGDNRETNDQIPLRTVGSDTDFFAPKIDPRLRLHPDEFIYEASSIIIDLIFISVNNKPRIYPREEVISYIKRTLLSAYIMICNTGCVVDILQESFEGRDVSRLVDLFQRYPQFPSKKAFADYLRDRYDFRSRVYDVIDIRLKDILEKGAAVYNEISRFIVRCISLCKQRGLVCYGFHLDSQAQFEALPRLKKELTTTHLVALGDCIAFFMPAFKGRRTAETLNDGYDFLEQVVRCCGHLIPHSSKHVVSHHLSSLDVPTASLSMGVY